MEVRQARVLAVTALLAVFGVCVQSGRLQAAEDGMTSLPTAAADSGDADPAAGGVCHGDAAYRTAPRGRPRP